MKIAIAFSGHYNDLTFVSENFEDAKKILFCYQLVYSTKSEKIILPASAAALIINIIVNIVLIPILQQNGAVIASVFSEFATSAV